MSATPLTAKQRVLRKWPDARCLPGEGPHNVGLWIIRAPGKYNDGNVYSNHCTSAKKAWQNAAKNL